MRIDHGRGSPAWFSESYPLLITETCWHTNFYDEILRKTTYFWLFFANSLVTHPCLWKICRKRYPCLENFEPENPPIWTAHTRNLNILRTPPPRRGLDETTFFLSKETNVNKDRIETSVFERRKVLRSSHHYRQFTVAKFSNGQSVVFIY